jgi:hypothetical protein
MGTWSYGLNLASKSEFLSNTTAIKNTNSAPSSDAAAWQKTPSYNGVPSINHVLSTVFNTALQTQTPGDSGRKGG